MPANKLINTLTELATSKKALALVGSNGLIQSMGGLTPWQQALYTMVSTAAYMIAQGIADHGKHRKMSVEEMAAHVHAEVNKKWREESDALVAKWKAEQGK